MIEQPMEKLEHTSDNNFVIVTAATASSDGTKATHCKVCGAELETESYSLTMEEKNALRSANDYLSFMAFSKKGLIEQLKYEGYSTEAATNAVNSLDVDWNEQAAKSAGTIPFLHVFFPKRIVSQLQYEGFTREEAEYGATAVGY